MAGAVRLRPILLTTLAIVLGSAIMLPDPVFGGLAISLIFGTLASTACSGQCCRRRSTSSPPIGRSEEHTSKLQSLMRISYAVFCLKKKKKNTNKSQIHKEPVHT